MTYAEFLARPSSVNDAECAEIVMRWEQEMTWRGLRWRSLETKHITVDDVTPFSPTTDRNATDLLLAEVERRGLVLKTLSILLDDDSIASTTWGCLRAAASLVAWACVEACKEEA